MLGAFQRSSVLLLTELELPCIPSPCRCWMKCFELQTPGLLLISNLITLGGQDVNPWGLGAAYTNKWGIVLESSEIWTGLALAQPSSSHSRHTQTTCGRFMHSNRRITSCIFINMQLGYSVVSFPSTPLVSIITTRLRPADLPVQSPLEGLCFNVLFL